MDLHLGEVPLEEQLFRLYQLLDMQLQCSGPAISMGAGGWPSAAD